MVQIAEEYKGVVLKGVVVVVAFLVVLWVFGYPVLSRFLVQDEQVVQARADLKRQKVFLPVYTELADGLQSVVEEALPMPKKEPVFLDAVGGLPGVVGALAQESGLEVLDVVLDPSTLRDGSGRMMLQSITMGSLEQYREFFIRLNGQPFVAGVERVEMQAVPGGVEVFMQFWLHVKKGAGKSVPAAGEQGGGA